MCICKFLRVHSRTRICIHTLVKITHLLSHTMQQLTGKKLSPANALERLNKHFCDMDAGTDDSILLLVDEVGDTNCVCRYVCVCVVCVYVVCCVFVCACMCV